MGVLHLRLEVTNETTSVEVSVKAAAQDIEQRGIVRSASGADSTPVAILDHVMEQSEQGQLYRALANLIEKLDVLIGIVDEASKVCSKYIFYKVVIIICD